MTDNLFITRRRPSDDPQRTASRALLAVLAEAHPERADRALLDEATNLAHAAGVVGMILLDQLRTAAQNDIAWCLRHIREAAEDELRTVGVADLERGGCGQPAGRTARLQRLLTSDGPIWVCSARSVCGSPCSPTDDNRAPRLTRPTQPRGPGL